MILKFVVKKGDLLDFSVASLYLSFQIIVSIADSIVLGPRFDRNQLPYFKHRQNISEQQELKVRSGKFQLISS